MREVDMDFIDDYVLGVNQFFYRKRIGVEGYMTKANKDGSLPKNFQNVPGNSVIYTMTEDFRAGWKFSKIENTQNSAWLRLRHPLGFEVKVHTRELLNIMDSSEIVNREIMRHCKYDPKAKILIFE